VMPSSSAQAPRILDTPEAPPPRTSLETMVPTKRNRAYDMRRVLRQILDPGTYCAIADRFGPSVLCGLGRLSGYPVGIIASQPMMMGGAITPDACVKMTRHMVLCDSFNLPLIFLQDTPGFIVGRAAEHARLLTQVGRLFTAWKQVTTPVISLVMRKAFGLAYYAMGGTSMGNALHLAWPGAELSFMDPGVGGSVLTTGQFNRQQQFTDLIYDTSPYVAAGLARIDEIIAPEETTEWLSWAIRRLWHPDGMNSEGRMRNWPVR
jgi:methylmalonyl-CoA decarboxylase subunit alpha